LPPTLVVDVQYFDKLAKLLDKTGSRAIGTLTKFDFILAVDDPVEQRAILILF
jgi:hypothetical protein